MASISKKSIGQLGGVFDTNPTSTVQYSRIEWDSASSALALKPYTTPYNFKGLSTKTVLYNGDWLDRLHINGFGSAYNTAPVLLKTYSFIQFLVPTQGHDGAAWGAMGEGLWPRSLPYLFPLDGISFGRTQIVPLDTKEPDLTTMAHESGHTLYGF